MNSMNSIEWLRGHSRSSDGVITGGRLVEPFQLVHGQARARRCGLYYPALLAHLRVDVIA